MHSRLPFLLLPLSLFSAGASAGMLEHSDPWLLCGKGPLFDFYQPLPAATPEQRAAAVTTFDAERFNVANRNRYILEGHAEIRRADQRLLADRLSYDHEQRQYEAEGDVRYQDADLLLRAKHLQGDIDADQVTAEDLQYQLLSARGNGDAAAVLLKGQTSMLSGVGYSTCDPDARAWEFRARQIDLDQARGVGTARGATLRIGGWPVIYLPYATFPLDERRKSGFLFPNIGFTEENGFDLLVPYYLNLAPNYDATLMARLIAKRGAMLGGEFRYLGANYRGELTTSWLPDDALAHRDRGSVVYHHDSTLNEHWNAHANLNYVSDDRYFEDLGDSLAAASTSLLESDAGFYGRGRTWTASVSAQDWQITDPFVDDSSKPFRRLPRALLDWEQPAWGGLMAGFQGEGVVFNHSERPDAQRIDLYPYLSWPIERAGWFVRPQAGYRYTGYRLDRNYTAQGGFKDHSPERGTEILSLDSGMVLERATALFGNSMRQTLEPRLFYLYVPYEKQSDLPILDTQELTFDFAQLFRTNRFSGADRQADANQATLTLSSRFYDENTGDERLALSLGQIRYFDPLEVQMPGAPVENRSDSPWVGQADLTLDERWNFTFSQQWDSYHRHTELSALRGQYRFGNGGIANLAYRYRRDPQSEDPLLEQVDASFLAPVHERLNLIGRWNYSLLGSTTLESFGGFEWDACCYSVRLLVRHYVRNREGDKNNTLYLEFELKGLGSFGRKTGELLDRAILGYVR